MWRVRAVALLTVAVSLGAAPRSHDPFIQPPSGAGLALDLGFEVALVGRHDALAAEPWQRDGSALVRHLGSPDLDATLRLSPATDAGVDLDVSVHWRRTSAVRQLALVVRVPGEPMAALGHELQLGELAHPTRVDRGTPIVARAGRLVVVGGEGFVAARYRPGHDITLVLDDEDAHPFRVYTKCIARYVAPLPASERTRRSQASLSHPAGEVLHARAQLLVADAGAVFAPAIVERWADGARAALVFTDHADRTDLAVLRLVAAAFAANGLKLTKTFFVTGGQGSLDGAAARTLADQLVTQGDEVAPHTITPRPDGRAAVAAGLAVMARWHPVTWIDHQPETNCEGINAEGASDDRRFGGLAAELVAAGYRWVWNDQDVYQHGRTATLADVFARGPPIYPLPRDPRLWMFVSTWFYATPRQLAGAASETAMDALERARGLFVGHTYLSPSRRTTRRPDERRRVVVTRGKLDPALASMLAQLGARVRSGTLASLTWRDAGDRLRALDDVHVRYRPDGATIENRGAVPVTGLTVAVPSNTPLALDGAQARGFRHEPGRETVWFDLPAGAHVVLRGASVKADAATLELR